MLSKETWERIRNGASALTVASLLLAAGGWVAWTSIKVNQIDDFGASLKELSDGVSALTSGRFNTITATSPYTLTSRGKDISTDIGGKNLIKPFASELAEESAGMEPFEIQNMSFDYVHAKYRASVEFKRLVNRGSYRNGVTDWAIIDILAIELRDALLELSEKRE